MAHSLSEVSKHVPSVTQIHIQAWGSVAAGDSVSIEMWRGSGSQNINESIVYDISAANPSQAPDQWTNISWDPQVTYLQNPYVTNQNVFLGGNSYSMGMVLRSDSSRQHLVVSTLMTGFISVFERSRNTLWTSRVMHQKTVILHLQVQSYHSTVW